MATKKAKRRKDGRKAKTKDGQRKRRGLDVHRVLEAARWLILQLDQLQVLEDQASDPLAGYRRDAAEQLMMAVEAVEKRRRATHRKFAVDGVGRHRVTSTDILRVAWFGRLETVLKEHRCLPVGAFAERLAEATAEYLSNEGAFDDMPKLETQDFVEAVRAAGVGTEDPEGSYADIDELVKFKGARTSASMLVDSLKLGLGGQKLAALSARESDVSVGEVKDATGRPEEALARRVDLALDALHISEGVRDAVCHAIGSLPSEAVLPHARLQIGKKRTT